MRTPSESTASVLRVLYLGAGRPVAPRCGMDLVVQEHLRELGADPRLEVTAFFAVPGVPGGPSDGSYRVGAASVQVHQGDLLGNAGLRRAIDKAHLLLALGMPVMSYSYKSAALRRAIREALAGRRFDVVVVDHIYTLANVTVRQLARCGMPVVYVSHDQQYHHIRSMASERPTRLNRAYYRWEAVRTQAHARRLFGVSARTVHLSSFESAEAAAEGPGRHAALLPPLFARTGDSAGAAEECAAPDAGAGDFGDAVVFVGSPGHWPNAQAIEWIRLQLAPALRSLQAPLRIVLVGGQTDRIDLAATPNVQGLGYVSEAELHHILHSCLCSISPITVGRGIKVKILESLALGCPVLATAESLRGFEAFGMDPAIDLADPLHLARQLVGLHGSAAARRAAREDAARRWQAFLAARHGAFAHLLRACLETRPTLARTPADPAPQA